MANASPHDTRAGFDIFRSSGGSLSLDELNAQLYEAGYGRDRGTHNAGTRAEG